MKTKTLLITVATAALMAGGTVVSAQAPSGRDSSGTPSGGSQMSPGSQGSQSQQQSPRGEGRQGTTGQSSPSERQGGQSGQTQQRQGSGSESQPQQRPQSGQSQQGASPSGAPSQSTQSGQQNRSGQSGTSTQQSQSAPSGGGAASANITTEQRTRIRETVLKTGNAPRVSSVNFSVSVGTAVPRTVKLAPVPTTIVEIQPAWRGFMFFIVGDQIVIVQPDTLKIVAVVAA